MLTVQKPNKRPRINYALAATLLASGATLAQAAEKAGAANATALRVCMARKGVTVKQIRTGEHHLEHIATVARRAVSQASEEMRELLGGELAKTTAALSKVRLKANVRDLKARADVLEPLARTAKIVHDWGNTQAVGLISLGGVNQVEQLETEQKPAIDLQSIPAAVEPETTSGSGSPA